MILTAAAHGAVAEQTVKLVMQTSEGNINVELYPERAPMTASNFLRLVDGGYYDGATFYRVVNPGNDNGKPEISVIQGGRGESESPFAAIEHESTEQSALKHLDGTISMARGDIGTASSEFFICLGAQPGLDFGETRNPDRQGFAAFGRVIAGMEIVRRINGMPARGPAYSAYVEGQILSEPVRIESVRRLTSD